MPKEKPFALMTKETLDLQVALNAARTPSVIMESAKPYIDAFEKLMGRKPKFVPMLLRQTSSMYFTIGVIYHLLDQLYCKWTKHEFAKFDLYNTYLRLYLDSWKTPIACHQDIQEGIFLFFNYDDLKKAYELENDADVYEQIELPPVVGWTNILLVHHNARYQVDYDALILNPAIISADTITEFIDILLAAVPILQYEAGIKCAFKEATIISPILLLKTTETEVEGETIRNFEYDGVAQSTLLGEGVISSTYLSKPIGNSVAEDRFSPMYNPYGLQVRELKPVDCLSLPDEILCQIVDSKKYFANQFQQLTAYKNNPLKQQELLAASRAQLLSSIFNSAVHHLVVSNKDNKPIGIMIYTAEEFKAIELDIFFLIEEERNKGYGTWLLKNFFQEIYLQPKSQPLVKVTTIGSNERLLNFYMRHGFAPYALEVTFDTGKSKKLASILPS